MTLKKSSLTVACLSIALSTSSTYASTPVPCLDETPPAQITYTPLTLQEFDLMHPTIIDLYNKVKNHHNDTEFKNFCFTELKSKGIPFNLSHFNTYVTQRANELYDGDAPLTLKLTANNSYLGEHEGKHLFLNDKLYRDLLVTYNYFTQITFDACRGMPSFYTNLLETSYGITSLDKNLFGSNTLSPNDFLAPHTLQAHVIIGQTLGLTGTFGEIMKKALTLDHLKVKELSCFPGFLLTPPKDMCHGGAVTLIPATGNYDLGLISHAQWLTAHGFVTYIVDTYYGSNISGGISNPLASPMQNEIITAFRARQVLSSHPYVNKNMIGVGGFSRGGTVADMTSREEFYAMHSHDGKPFSFEYAYYPTILLQQRDLKVSRGPKLYLTGDSDPFVDVDNTSAYMNRLKEDGIDAELKVYADTTHSFDAAEPYYNSDFPVVGNDKVNLLYDEDGFIAADMPHTKLAWDILPAYIGQNVKFGFQQTPNPTAKQQSKEDLLAFFKEKVGIHLSGQ